MKFILNLNIQSSIKEIILVISQFIIIIFHFININLFTQRIIQIDENLLDVFGNVFIILGFILIIIAFKDLGKSISPMPKPKDNSKLITTGIYNFIKHPMYYSLIIISLGYFIKSLTFYNLFLTTLLVLILFTKINIEEKYLKRKYKNYSLYKKRLKI